MASAIADEKKLQSDAETMKKQAEDWERAPCWPSRRARTTWPSRRSCATTSTLQGAQQLQRDLAKHKAETEQLKLSLRELNDKIEEAKRKKNILVARAKRAEAQQRIQETMSRLSDKSAFESFERMAEKIEATERKAIAAAELKEEVSGDPLVQQFEALEYKGSSDQQLDRAQGRDGTAEAPGAGRRRAARQRVRVTSTTPSSSKRETKGPPADAAGRGSRRRGFPSVGFCWPLRSWPSRSARSTSCWCVFLAVILGVYLEAVSDFLSSAAGVPRSLGLAARRCRHAGALVGIVLSSPRPWPQVQDLLTNPPQLSHGLDAEHHRAAAGYSRLPPGGAASGGTPGLLACRSPRSSGSCAAPPFRTSRAGSSF